MKRFLIAITACAVVFALGAAPQKKAAVYLDKSGSLRIADELRFGGDTYIKRVNYKQGGKSWKCDTSSFDKASDISVNSGKIIIANEPETSYRSTLAGNIDGSYTYTLSITGNSRSFTCRTGMPAAQFVGRELIMDGKKVLFPLEKGKGKKAMVLFSGRVRKAGIPCRDSFVELEFEKPVYITVHDYRPGTQSFSFIISMVKGSNASHLRFKVTDTAYISHPIDLRKAVNMGFVDKKDSDGRGGWTDQGPENDLRMLPTGKKRFKGTDFDIINPKKNGGKSCIVLKGSARDYFPASAQAEVNGKLRGNYLYLLHARAWGSSGATIGTVKLTYTDGTSSDIPVHTRKDLGNWWSPSPTPNGDVVWIGENMSASVGLFRSVYPIKNAPVKSITFTSNCGPVWMIIAASISDTAIPRDQSAPYYVVSGKDWKAVDFHKTVIDGSVMDFSHRLDAPAGKYGRVIIRNGNFCFEKQPEKAVRFYGSNLCSSANFVDKKWADVIVKRFAQFGFNLLRLHHHDGGLADKKDTTKLDPEGMDKVDYIIHRCKESGIYITTDFYVSRRLPAGEIPEYPGRLSNIQAYKALLWINETVWNNWKANVTNYLNHVNPYTKMRLIDDPVLVTVNIINEGNIKSHWATDAFTRKSYEQRFKEWRKEKNLSENVDSVTRNREFEEFLTEVYEKRYKQMVEFIRTFGTKVVLSDQNMGATPKLSQMRRLYDYVDNHGYSSHPSFPVNSWKLPSALKQQSPVTSAHPVPWHLPASRLVDKPFTVTEFDYAKPNRFRAAGPAIIGAVGASQSWDMLVQFAFSHGRENFMLDNRANNHFDLSTDCIKSLAHRIGTALFFDGGVPEAKKSFVVLLSEESYIPFGAEFPGEVSQLAQIAKVGTFIVGREGDLSKLPADTAAVIDIGVGFPSGYKGKYPVFKAVKGGNSLIPSLIEAGLLDKKCYDKATATATSEDGRISLSKVKGTFKAAGTQCEALVLPAKMSGKAQIMSVENKVGHAVFGLIATDKAPLKNSKRMLLLHLTDTQATKAKFSSAKMTMLEKWGAPPFLAARGEAKITLDLDPKNYRLFAVDTAGKRLQEIKFSSAGKKISFDAKIFNKSGQVLAYELTAK